MTLEDGSLYTITSVSRSKSIEETGTGASKPVVSQAAAAAPARVSCVSDYMQ